MDQEKLEDYQIISLLGVLITDIPYIQLLT